MNNHFCAPSISRYRGPRRQVFVAGVVGQNGWEITNLNQRVHSEPLEVSAHDFTVCGKGILNCKKCQSSIGFADPR